MAHHSNSTSSTPHPHDSHATTGAAHHDNHAHKDHAAAHDAHGGHGHEFDYTDLALLSSYEALGYKYHKKDHKQPEKEQWDKYTAALKDITTSYDKDTPLIADNGTIVVEEGPSLADQITDIQNEITRLHNDGKDTRAFESELQRMIPRLGLKTIKKLRQNLEAIGGRVSKEITDREKFLLERRKKEYMGAVGTIISFYKWREVEEKEKENIPFFEEESAKRRVVKLRDAIAKEAAQASLSVDHTQKLLNEAITLEELKKRGVNDAQIIKDTIDAIKKLELDQRSAVGRWWHRFTRPKAEKLAEEQKKLKAAAKKEREELAGRFAAELGLSPAFVTTLIQYEAEYASNTEAFQQAILDRAVDGSELDRLLMRSNFVNPKDGSILSDDALKKNPELLKIKTFVATQLEADWPAFARALPEKSSSELLEKLEPLRASGAPTELVELITSGLRNGGVKPEKIREYIDDHNLDYTPVGLLAENVAREIEKAEELKKNGGEKKEEKLLSDEQCKFIDALNNLARVKRKKEFIEKVCTYPGDLMTHFAPDRAGNPESQKIVEYAKTKVDHFEAEAFAALMPDFTTLNFLKRFERNAKSETEKKLLTLLVNYYANSGAAGALANIENFKKDNKLELSKELLFLLDRILTKNFEEIAVGNKYLVVGDEVTFVDDEYVDGATNEYQIVATGKVVKITKLENTYEVTFLRFDGKEVTKQSHVLGSALNEKLWAPKIAGLYRRPGEFKEESGESREANERYRQYLDYMTSHTPEWLAHDLTPQEIRAQLGKIKQDFGVRGLEQVTDDKQLADTWLDLLWYFQARHYRLREPFAGRIAEDGLSQAVLLPEGMYGHASLRKNGGDTHYELPVMQGKIVTQLEWDEPDSTGHGTHRAKQALRGFVPHSLEPGDLSGVVHTTRKPNEPKTHAFRRIVDGTLVTIDTAPLVAHAAPDSALAKDVAAMMDDTELWVDAAGKLEGSFVANGKWYLVKNGVAEPLDDKPVISPDGTKLSPEERAKREYFIGLVGEDDRTMRIQELLGYLKKVAPGDMPIDAILRNAEYGKNLVQNNLPIVEINRLLRTIQDRSALFRPGTPTLAEALEDWKEGTTPRFLYGRVLETTDSHVKIGAVLDAVHAASALGEKVSVATAFRNWQKAKDVVKQGFSPGVLEQTLQQIVADPDLCPQGGETPLVAVYQQWIFRGPTLYQVVRDQEQAEKIKHSFNLTDDDYDILLNHIKADVKNRREGVDILSARHLLGDKHEQEATYLSELGMAETLTTTIGPNVIVEAPRSSKGRAPDAFSATVPDGGRRSPARETPPQAAAEPTTAESTNKPVDAQAAADSYLDSLLNEAMTTPDTGATPADATVQPPDTSASPDATTGQKPDAADTAPDAPNSKDTTTPDTTTPDTTTPDTTTPDTTTPDTTTPDTTTPDTTTPDTGDDAKKPGAYDAVKDLLFTRPLQWEKRKIQDILRRAKVKSEDEKATMTEPDSTPAKTADTESPTQSADQLNTPADTEPPTPTSLNDEVFWEPTEWGVPVPPAEPPKKTPAPPTEQAPATVEPPTELAPEPTTDKKEKRRGITPDAANFLRAYERGEKGLPSDDPEEDKPDRFITAKTRLNYLRGKAFEKLLRKNNIKIGKKKPEDLLEELRALRDASPITEDRFEPEPIRAAVEPAGIAEPEAPNETTLPDSEGEGADDYAMPTEAEITKEALDDKAVVANIVQALEQRPKPEDQKPAELTPEKTARAQEFFVQLANLNIIAYRGMDDNSPEFTAAATVAGEMGIAREDVAELLPALERISTGVMEQRYNNFTANIPMRYKRSGRIEKILVRTRGQLQRLTRDVLAAKTAGERTDKASEFERGLVSVRDTVRRIIMEQRESKRRYAQAAKEEPVTGDLAVAAAAEPPEPPKKPKRNKATAKPIAEGMLAKKNPERKSVRRKARSEQVDFKDGTVHFGIDQLVTTVTKDANTTTVTYTDETQRPFGSIQFSLDGDKNEYDVVVTALNTRWPAERVPAGGIKEDLDVRRENMAALWLSIADIDKEAGSDASVAVEELLSNITVGKSVERDETGAIKKLDADGLAKLLREKLTDFQVTVEGQKLAIYDKADVSHENPKTVTAENLRSLFVGLTDETSYEALLAALGKTA